MFIQIEEHTIINLNALISINIYKSGDGAFGIHFFYGLENTSSFSKIFKTEDAAKTYFYILMSKIKVIENMD
jgi:hypothetical protein